MDKPTEKLWRTITHFFITKDFQSNYLGYEFTKACIRYVIEKDFEIDTIGEVYAKVAEEKQANLSSVERCIRTFIDKSWQQLGLFNKRPTNHNFIARCAEIIALEM